MTVVEQLALYPLIDGHDSQRIFTHYRDALKTISYQIESVVLTHNIQTRVFAGFQRFSYFLPRAQQYQRLGRVAKGVWVFGIDDITPPELPGVHYIPLTAEHNLSKEWFMVVDSPEYFSALVAQDISGFDLENDARSFRGIWTFDNREVSLLQQTLSTALGLDPLTDSNHPAPYNYHRQLTQVAESANALVNQLQIKNTELRQAQALREDLVNMLVHDMRNPLAAIASNLELLEKYRQHIPEDEQIGLVSVALQSTSELSHMISDLLDIARMEEGRLELMYEALEPTDLLAKAARKAQKLTQKSSRKVAVQVEEPLPNVLGEPEKIDRVFDNLLTNGIKYTSENGLLAFSAVRDDGYVRFALRDDGPGIPIEAQGRIFEKFQQVGGASQRRGTGLGLAFCRMIIQAHGGRIWVESTAGQGSTFYFTLPIAQ